MKLLLTESEALAELPGVSRSTLRGWIAAGVVRRERLLSRDSVPGVPQIPCGEVPRVRGLLERGEPVMPEQSKRAYRPAASKSVTVPATYNSKTIAELEREILALTS